MAQPRRRIYGQPRPDHFLSMRRDHLTFDCYGTLIDWERGACKALRDVYDGLVSNLTEIVDAIS